MAKKKKVSEAIGDAVSELAHEISHAAEKALGAHSKRPKRKKEPKQLGAIQQHSKFDKFKKGNE